MKIPNFLRQLFKEDIDFTIYLEENAIFLEPKTSRRYADAKIFDQDNYVTTVTHEIIEKIKAIPTNESRGYTPDFISSVIQTLYDNLDKAMVILANNHHHNDDDFNKKMTRVVTLMNKSGIDFQEASQIVARSPNVLINNITLN